MSDERKDQNSKKEKTGTSSPPVKDPKGSKEANASAAQKVPSKERITKSSSTSSEKISNQSSPKSLPPDVKILMNMPQKIVNSMTPVKTETLESVRVESPPPAPMAASVMNSREIIQNFVVNPQKPGPVKQATQDLLKEGKLMSGKGKSVSESGSSEGGKEEKVKIKKPVVIISRIFGVTSSVEFGDAMFTYFMEKFNAYLSNHWSDPMTVEIINNLRDEVAKSNINLPPIAPATESKEKILASIDAFVKKRSEINLSEGRTAGIVVPSYTRLKSMVIRAGIDSKDIISHVYDDVPVAFKIWSEVGKIKIYTLSSGPPDGQIDFFAKTHKGDLTPYITTGISTVNPQITGKSDSKAIDFRELAKKIIKVEPNACLLLTDKLKDAQQAQRTDMNVILVAREGKLGHKSLQADKDSRSDIPMVTSFTSIVFTD